MEYVLEQQWFLASGCIGRKRRGSELERIVGPGPRRLCVPCWEVWAPPGWQWGAMEGLYMGRGHGQAVMCSLLSSSSLEAILKQT